MEVDDTLVGAAAEEEVGVPLLQDEGAVHQHVQVGEHLREVGIGLNLFQREAGPAPDGFGGLLLDAAGQLREGLHLIERISAGKGDVRQVVGLYNLQQLLYVHLFAALEIPALGVVAALAGMLASRTINGSPQSRPIGHGLVQYI